MCGSPFLLAKGAAFCVPPKQKKEVLGVLDVKDLNFIQDQIGYTFRNRDLLQQAFVRKSYSAENGGQNNEVLEFIGDKVLDLMVIRMLTERYGSITENEEWSEYSCRYDEGGLTEIKSSLVEKKTLAQRMKELGFAKYLIMGRGDELQKVDRELSVQEDLFEAILGAVALDSDWDMKAMQDTVEIMLNPDEFLEEAVDDYVGLLQAWVLKDTGTRPLYHYRKGSFQAAMRLPFDGISQEDTVDPEGQEYKDILTSSCQCYLKLNDDLPLFRGFGDSNSQARKNVCRLAYDYLKTNNLLSFIRREIRDPNRSDAINQLETLARRGYFAVPKYGFTQRYDKDGNSVWTARCVITGEQKRFTGTSSSKREAKKSAAYRMLRYVLETY